MDLLNVYNGMQKKAALDKVARERVEILTKYVSLAEEMLSSKHGDNYNEADVTKLAGYLIERDVELHDAQEKIAEYTTAGKIMAKAFLDEVNSK